MLAAIPAPTPNLQRLSKKPKGRSEEESFSGFTKLASVAFTDLTSLDCIADIAGCIKASSSTLRSFSLSLSWVSRLRTPRSFCVLLYLRAQEIVKTAVK